MLRPIAQSLLLPLLVGQLLLVPSAVCAGDPPPLQLAGTLPFSAEQLTQALSLRPPPEGWSAQIVRVAGAETGPLVVSVGPHRLSLDLGGAEGMAAARLVALALVALLGEGAPGSEPTASPSATSPSVASATAPSVASATAPSIAHRAPTAAPTPSSAASTAPPVQGTNADHAPAVASAGREVRLAVEAMGSVGRGLGRLELWGAGFGAGLLGDSRSLLFGGAFEGVVVPGATREGLRRTMVALRAPMRACGWACCRCSWARCSRRSGSWVVSATSPRGW